VPTCEDIVSLTYAWFSESLEYLDNLQPVSTPCHLMACALCDHTTHLPFHLWLATTSTRATFASAHIQLPVHACTHSHHRMVV
jgi:hypothetical protein